MISWKSLITITAVLIFTGCKKDNKIEAYSSVAFNFTATANNKRLSVNSTKYTNPSGDSFTVTKFNYYISNIRFTRDDGVVYSEPESYRINRHVGGPTSFVVSGIPEGTYRSVEFLIGVDSVRNSSGAQTGALDISQGMYWDWLTGYVFFKLEGNYTTSRSPVPSEYAMHVGTSANVQKCLFNFGVNSISARRGKQSSIYYTVNIDEIFAHPANLNFDTYHAVSGGPLAAVISNNYKDMFSVSRVEN